MGEISTITSKRKKYIMLKIIHNNIKYDDLLVLPLKIVFEDSMTHSTSEIALCKDMSSGDFQIKKIPMVNVNGILAHYIVQELIISSLYRKKFINTILSLPNFEGNKIIFYLQPVEKQILDYSWNERTTRLVWERIELDYALSWLSTLGGAFSALGDYFSNCAVIAGKISFQQLQLALKLGDPTVAARCRLYFSLSLIQRGYFKEARNIIFREYNTAKREIVVDIRLIKMCLGIWAKLKYEYGRKRNCKT